MVGSIITLDGNGNPQYIQASTGSGTSGSPYVTDHNIASIANGTNSIGTIQPGNIANTTPWLFSPSTGGNTAAVKAASTAPLSTDPALVVTISPNSAGIQSLGQATAANSAPVVLPNNLVWGSPSAAMLGSYSMSLVSGTIGAGIASAAAVFSLTYGGSSLMLVRRVLFAAQDITTGFTAGQSTFKLFAARSFTAADTGGTAATLTGNNGKLRTSFASTGVSNFMIANTSALSAGTRTLDSTALQTLTVSTPTTVGFQLFNPSTVLFQSGMGEQPIQLANNEGLVLEATVPATGTWTLSVQVAWDEVSSY